MHPSYAIGYLNGYWIKFIFKGARHRAQLQSTLPRRVGRHAVSSRRALNSCFGGQPRAAQNWSCAHGRTRADVRSHPLLLKLVGEEQGRIRFVLLHENSSLDFLCFFLI